MKDNNIMTLEQVTVMTDFLSSINTLTQNNGWNFHRAASSEEDIYTYFILARNQNKNTEIKLFTFKSIKDFIFEEEIVIFNQRLELFEQQQEQKELLYNDMLSTTPKKRY